MKTTDYSKMYDKIFGILGDLTPLKADCGQLCNGACCKGDTQTGMRLFPHEESCLKVTENESGNRLAVCDGSCDRTKRPLSCRIFPFFPTIDEKGRIFIEPDYRASRLCPLIEHMEEVKFDPRFFRALKKAGKTLAKDEECRRFLYDITQEIDVYYSFLQENK